MSDLRATRGQPKRGAQQHVLTKQDQRRHWFAHHGEVAKDCLRQWLSAPVSTLMTILVLAVALALPSFLFTSLANITRLTSGWDDENKISLYLHTNLSESQIEGFSQRLLLRPDLIAIDLIDAEQGLLEFKQYSGFSDLLGSLQQNPLPAVIAVLARDTSEQSLEVLQQQLSALPQVEQAVLDLQWIKRLNAMLLVLERAIIALSLLLAFAVLLIIGNTIRLNVESRRDEILVAKLMGATNAWVRRPFLYTGIFYGVTAAISAWLIIEMSLVVMQTPVLHLTLLYQSNFKLIGLGAFGGLLLLVVGLSLGLLAALISVNKFLNQLEPK
ncbi:MAG: permease-like cell division protein FtsX [Pseudomonadales bacterium]|nr:permease-like cell division protein FtsX [Pseudomonadales bacterium]NRA15722.1 ABC transporter permease [Oceanospirillaceae bacterium]